MTGRSPHQPALADPEDLQRFFQSHCDLQAVPYCFSMFVGKDHISLLLMRGSSSWRFVTCNYPESLVSLCERFCTKFVPSTFSAMKKVQPKYGVKTGMHKTL